MLNCKFDGGCGPLVKKVGEILYGRRNFKCFIWIKYSVVGFDEVNLCIIYGDGDFIGVDQIIMIYGLGWFGDKYNGVCSFCWGKRNYNIRGSF